MPCRVLDEDILHQTPVAHMDFQERGALDALPSGGFRIARFDLIPPQRSGQPTAITGARWQTGYPCATTRPSPTSTQASPSRPPASTTGPCSRHDSHIPPVEQLPGARFAAFHGLRRCHIRRSLRRWPQDIATRRGPALRRQGWRGARRRCVQPPHAVAVWVGAGFSAAPVPEVGS